MRQIYILFLLIGNIGLGQDWEGFSGEERAFFYHQTRRTEVLRLELFNLFEYADSIPYINDTLPDYGYVERQIVADRSLLSFHSEEIPRQSQGVVMDLATRYALWELAKVLQFRNSTAEADKPLKEKLKRFEQLVIEEAPQKAVRTITSGEYVLVKNIDQYFAPSLTVSDKLAVILNSGFTQSEQMLIINAVMTAEQKYVNERVKEIYYQLGGTEQLGVNLLSAVGDGSNRAEIVGGFNTPYTIGLPDEKGLFRFKVIEYENKERERTDLVIKSILQYDFTTVADRNTIVHVDVFGYHPERQTTIAIQKGANSYVLFGKNEHRLVSPDSSFGEGTTYWRLMQSLERDYIARIKEDLYGKRGYEYQIDLYEQKIEKTKLQIKATEIRLDKLRHTPEGKPKIKKKKLKKKNLGMSDQAGKGHPTSALSKLDKKKNIEQNRLIQLNNQLDGQKSTLAELKEDMEKAYENLVKYETRLDFMRKNIGYTIMEYTYDNDLYTFKDGATFNYSTQDFTFPAAEREESFGVYHISFGKAVLDEKLDENFAHIHVTDRLSDAEYNLSRIIRYGDEEKMTPSDSLQIRELFSYWSTHKGSSRLILKAGGIGNKEDGSIKRESNQESIGFDAAQFKNMDQLHYYAQFKGEMEIVVTAYTGDMLTENFSFYEPVYLKLKAKYPTLTKADFYTAMLAKQSAKKWLEYLNKLAERWLVNNGDRKAVMAQIKKLKVSKVFVSDDSIQLNVPDL